MDDIRSILRQGLSQHQYFRDRDESYKERTLDHLALTSDSSILWTSLAIQYLKQQKSHPTLDQALETLSSSPKTTSDIVEKVFHGLQLNPQSETILSILVTAERPLSLPELESLLQAHPEDLSRGDRKPNLPSLLKPIAPFTVVGEGLVTIRHASLRHILSKHPMHIKDPQSDLLARLWICTRSSFSEDQDPTLTFLEPTQARQLFHANRLLEYTTRYWITHFRKSPIFKSNGDLTVPKGLEKVFPGSVTFPLLEEHCWRLQMLPQHAVDYHTISYSFRKALFGEDHPSVLQTTIVIAIIFDRLLSQPKQAIQWYYRAIKTGSRVLGPQSDLVVTISHGFLSISETSITKTRTDTVNYREEVLLLLITAYKHRYGSTSKEVTEINQKLSLLYTYIGEHEKATEIEKSTGNIIETNDTASTTGRTTISGQDGSITRSADVTVHGHKQREVVDIYQNSLFAKYVEQTEASFTLERVELSIRRAGDLVKHGDFEKAEEIYIELWWKIAEHCHSVHELEWHRKKLELMLTYARFLQTRKRTDDASSILLSAWKEFEHSEFSMSESIIILLKEVAITMRAVGLTSISLNVFQRCWNWFRNSRKENTGDFKQIEEHIASTSRDIVKNSTSTAVTTSSEVLIREILMQSLSSTDTQVNTNTIDLSKSLSSVYIEQQRYSDATEVLEKTLKKSWASLFAESVDSTTITSHLSSENAEMASRLAQCYINNKQYSKAESLYLRLYRVHKRNHSVSDNAVVKYGDVYLDFLNKHGTISQVISFHQELLVDYRSFYGPSHAQTVKTLYTLGDTCRSHLFTHGYWIEYYLDIIHVVNKTDAVCHESAMRALVIVAEHYFETQRYSESLTYFTSIITTFHKVGKDYEFFKESTEVQRILEKYYKSIEETKIDIGERIKNLKEIRDTCIKHYGESSSVTLVATTTLAETCVRSEKHKFEAVSYYEHVLKHSKSISSETVTRSQNILRSLYIKQITTSSSSQTQSREVVQRATSMLHERYTEIRNTHSVTSEITLTHLKDLVAMYQKEGHQELAIKELKSVLIEIVTNVHNAKEQTYAAEFLSSVFVTSGYRSQAFELIHEIKLQMIYKSTTNVSKHGFDVTKAGRSAFAFLTTFEYHIRADYSLSIAYIMSELVAEYLFYERFVECIRTNSKLQTLFIHAARLRRILQHNERIGDFGLVQSQLIDYFAATETQVAQRTSREAITLFVSNVLQYVSERANVHFKSFVIASSYAAVSQLRGLLQQKKHREALEVATCTYYFLMAHEGLDDPTEITLGFQLALLMAGREEGVSKSTDPQVQKSMMDLSRTILGTVFDICKNNNINIARVKLVELNELVSLVGETGDYNRLQWLLHTLWISRDGQTTWPQEVSLELGKRLVEVEFSLGKPSPAIRLCEDIVYNVRRVNGARHPRTLSFYTLLASLYTSLAKQYQSIQGDSNQKKQNEELAKTYYRKAVNVHEDVIKLLVDNSLDNSDDEDDLESELETGDAISIVASGPGQLTSQVSSGSRPTSLHATGRPTSSSSFSPRRALTRLFSSSSGHHGSGVNGTTSSSHTHQNTTITTTTTNGQIHTHSHSHSTFANRTEELELIRTHLRLLKLALQRYGGWTKPMSQFERLTSNITAQYGQEELKLKEGEATPSKWKIESFGHGKAEAEYGAFHTPQKWVIIHS